MAGETRTSRSTRRTTPGNRIRLLFTILAAFAGVGAAATAAAFHRDIAVGSLLLTSMTFSGIALRGRSLAANPGIIATSAVIFTVASVASARMAIIGYQQAADPGQLLGLAVFDVCALTVLFLAVASWLPRWNYREPAILAVQALTLGVLSLHGLTLLSSTLAIPRTSGFVLFYAYQPSSQPLYLNVNVTPSPQPAVPTYEFMDIVNPSKTRPASWAVLLTGDARLNRLETNGPDMHDQELTGRHVTTGALAEASGQLLWGTLPPGSIGQITGYPRASYINRDTTETAVSLPDFDVGSFLNTDSATLSTIARKLGTPGTSPGGLSIGVDAGSVSPLDTEVTALPPLTDPRQLSWTFGTNTAPEYKLVDQNAQDTLNNYSFALAVLLGAAGACLLASLQSVVSTASSRKERPASIKITD